MKIARLRTCHMDRPMGIDQNPTFSWTLESNRQNTAQAGYRITVALDGAEVWDSAWRISDENTFIPYEGAALSDCTACTWTVEVEDTNGERAKESSSFETAILSGAWTAHWAESALDVTKRESGFGKQPPATMFRKGFCLDEAKVVKSARLYATALGVFRAYVNGERADERELAPGYASYDKVQPYQSFDVTGLVKPGKNAIGFYVGDGWYFNRETAISKEATELGRHAVLFELRVRYADGTEEIVSSDASMKTAYGPVLFSDLFGGECFDARKQVKGWSCPDFDESAWVPVRIRTAPSARLLAAPDDLVLPVREFEPRIFTAPNGDLLADFSQNMAGVTKLNVQLPAGTRVELEHFEVLDENGNFANTIMSTNGIGGGADQKSALVSDGSGIEWSPYFTYFGFRYVRIRFFDAAGTELTGSDRPAFGPENLRAIALSTRKENLGTFTCSDEKINRLYSNIRWSQYANMLSIPTDCPQREKAGWTGDAGLYIGTALLNEDVTAFFTRWLESVKADQQEDGAVPMVVPFNETYRGMSVMMAQMMGCSGIAAPAGWGDACVSIPWAMYQATGNKEILKSSWQLMQNWCDYVIREAKKRGREDLPAEKEQYLWDTGFQYGEWVIPSTSKGGFDDQQATGMAMALTARYIAPIYGYLSVSTLAKAAEILGKDEDAARYGETAEHMSDAIRTCLVGENGEAPAEYMGAYVLMLAHDLVPEQWREKFEKRLLEMIAENGSCLDTGFLATPFLLQTLTEMGHRKEAYDLLFQTKCPSWLYEVEHGATTIWETWNAVGETGVPQHVSMDHYAFGCVAQWMFETIGGIRPAAPGFRRIVIEPQPDERLTFAEREYMSEQGLVRCAWKRTDSGYDIEVTVPCNVKAEIVLPDGTVHETGSGTYCFHSA